MGAWELDHPTFLLTVGVGMSDSPGMDHPLATIFERGGGVAALARKLGRSHSTLLGWERVPPAHVPEVSRITGVPRHELRPDLYEPPALSSEASVMRPNHAEAAE